MATSSNNEMNTTDKGLPNACDAVTFYGSALDRNDPFNTEGNGTAKFIGSPGAKTKSSSVTMAMVTATSAAMASTGVNLATATAKRNVRTDLSKNELLTMLCYLEGELQARDIVIAALRNERVKHMIHTLRNRPQSDSDDPQAALLRDKISSTGNLVSRQSSTTATQADLEVRALIEQQMDALYQMVSKQRSTHLRMVKVLKESLETNQRMRQELEDEKRKHEHDTAQGDDITYGLEMERTKLKQELETERNSRKKLEKDLKKLQETLDFERGRQKQIVLLLLAERKKIIMKYIEERKRSEDLAQILSEEKQRSDSIAEGLEEESKKSLRMEAELEKQTLAIENERKAMKINLAKDEKRIKELEMELAQLRSENEAFRKTASIVSSSVPSMRIPTSHNVPVSTLPAKVRAMGGDESSGLGPTMINVAKIVQPTSTVSSVPVSGPTTGIARSISPSVGFSNQPAKVMPVRKLSNQTSTTSTMPIGSGTGGGNIAQSSPLQLLSQSSSSTLSTFSTSSLSSSTSLSSTSSSTLPIHQQTQHVLLSSSSSSSSSSSTPLSMQSPLTAPVGSVDYVQQNITIHPAISLTSSMVQLSTVPIAVGGLSAIGKVPTQGVLLNSTSQQQQHQQQQQQQSQAQQQPPPLQQQQQLGTILRSSSTTSMTPAGGVVGAAGNISCSTTLSSQVIAAISVTGSSNSAGIARGIPPPIPPNKPIVPPKREPSISRLGSITANNISNSSS